MSKISFALINCFLFLNIIAVNNSKAATSGGAELKGFIVQSGYGAALGATAGLLMVALSDQPSSNTRDVAKGASLGLYAGIIYGLSKMQQSETKTFDWGVVPVINKNGCDGVGLVATVFKF